MSVYDFNVFEGLPSFFFGISPGFGQKLSDLIGIQHGIFKESVMPHMCSGVTCQVFIFVWNLEKGSRPVSDARGPLHDGVSLMLPFIYAAKVRVQAWGVMLRVGQTRRWERLSDSYYSGMYEIWFDDSYLKPWAAHTVITVILNMNFPCQTSTIRRYTSLGWLWQVQREGKIIILIIVILRRSCNTHRLASWKTRNGIRDSGSCGEARTWACVCHGNLTKSCVCKK